MPFTHRLAAAGACAAAVSAVAVPTAPAEVTALTAADKAGARALSLVEAHDRAVRRHVRLERRHARLQGKRPERGVARDVREWTLKRLREENREQERTNRQLDRRLERKRERREAAAAAAAARASASGRATGSGAVTSTGGAATPTGGAAPAHLQSIAQCESGGDPSAVGGGGLYGGKYQFSQSTWSAYGGTGSPASAPESEQDAIAARLYAAEGASPWPVCGR